MPRRASCSRWNWVFLYLVAKLSVFIVQCGSFVDTLRVLFANLTKKNLLTRATVGDEPIAIFDEAICSANIALHLSSGWFRYC